MEITLTSENFDSEVMKTDMPVLVDFWAPWCGRMPDARSDN